MNNLIRKEIRRIQDELAELEEALTSDIEKAFLQYARIKLVQADIRDFHIYFNKRYVEPKRSFKFKKK